MNDSVLQLAFIVAAYLTVLLIVVTVIRASPGPFAGLRRPLERWAGAPDRASDGKVLRTRQIILFLLDYIVVGVVLGIVVAAAVLVFARDTADTLSSIVTRDDLRRLVLAAILAWGLLLINVVFAVQFVDTLLPREAGGKKQFDRMGAGIGILERLLVVVLTLTAGPANISLVIAAKSLARFRQLSKQGFAERYLVGTLASVTIALASALVAQQIWFRIAR